MACYRNMCGYSRNKSIVGFGSRYFFQNPVSTLTSDPNPTLVSVPALTLTPNPNPNPNPTPVSTLVPAPVQRHSGHFRKIISCDLLSKSGKRSVQQVIVLFKVKRKKMH